MVSVCADCMIHAHMHSAIPRPLVLIFLFSIDLFGQAPQGPYVPPPVLARLERLQRHEDVCALIERSGKYRLERRFAAKHEVFEGSLSPTDLEQFAAILDAAELRNIFRTDVPHPMIVDTIDKFFIDVYRNDGEQHLSFNSPDARKKFRSGTDPVLKWLDKIQKADHKQVAESEASHCMPAPLRQGPSPANVDNRSMPKPYLMALLTDHFRGGRVERSCVIVYPDGRYRREKSIQEYLGTIRLHAFEGSLGHDQIGELRNLLDAPDLKSMKHRTQFELPAEEADATSLKVPRNSTVQHLEFAHSFQVLGNRDKPGGYSGMQYGLDPDERVLNPILNWLKDNVNNQSLNPLADSSPTNCDPGQ
jgi:hypothetical protein